MFVPLFHPDDEDEDHHNPNRHGEQEVMRLDRALPMVAVIKITNVLLLLSIGVAAFIQFCTLEPRYLSDLLWETTSSPETLSFTDAVVSDNGIQVLLADTEKAQYEDDMAMLDLLHSAPDASLPSSSLVIFLRFGQALAAILMLSFLRAVVFPNQSRHGASLLEAVLADLLFHIQCRFVIGFVTTCLLPTLFDATKVPFDMMEATVLCCTVALQLAKQHTTAA